MIIRSLAVLFLIVCFAYLSQACSVGHTTETLACTVGSVEAGADASLCDAGMVNPIVVTCGDEHPTAAQVGTNVRCEPGAPGVWCCVGLPDPCLPFRVCAEQNPDSIVCYDGTCACTGPTHEGRNEPVSCTFGAS